MDTVIQKPGQGFGLQEYNFVLGGYKPLTAVISSRWNSSIHIISSNFSFSYYFENFQSWRHARDWRAQHSRV